jgi:hypothetical protein
LPVTLDELAVAEYDRGTIGLLRCVRRDREQGAPP